MKCSYDLCDRPAASRGHCHAHYRQLARGHELTPIRRRAKRGEYPETCMVTDCEQSTKGRGLCEPHLNRERAGLPLDVEIRPRWTREEGERWIDPQGYVSVKRGRRNVREHREVMESILGRPLLPGENVHHRNGVKTDNDPQNLELWVVSQPAGQRPEDLVAWARVILDRYGSDTLI